VDGLLGVLQTALQRATDMVCVGLSHPGSVDTANLRMAGSFLNFVPAQQQRPNSDAVVRDFRVWAVGCGLRDCVEATNVFLEQLRFACAMYWLAGKGQFTGADYHETLGPKPAKRFHRLGLPYKISHLAEEYEFTLPGQYCEQVLSLNQARNCLVHRSGVVSAQDTNLDDRLRLLWEKPELVVLRQDGDVVVSETTFLHAGEKVGMRCRPTERIFVAGDILALSSAEFTEFCWTFFQFGRACISTLDDYGAARGVQKADPPQSTT